MTDARSNAIRALMQAMDAYGDDITFGQMIDAVEPIIRADEKMKADLAISFWVQENNSLRNRLENLKASVEELPDALSPSSLHRATVVDVDEVLDLIDKEGQG